MARDPQFEQQLNDAKKLLKQLNDIRMQLGRDPIKLTDPESVKQLKSLPSDIRDARKALDEMNGSASNLYSRLKAVTSEFKNQTSETANIRKGFRALTSIVEDLKFEEAGISDLNTKQLNNLHKRAKIERGRIEQSSKSLIKSKAELLLLDDEVEYLREMDKEQSQINDTVSERLKLINEKLGVDEKLSDEALAMLQSYYDQENTVDAIVQKTKERLDLEEAIDRKVSGFTFMKDLTESIPGLRVFSKPFQDAEDAARGAVKAAKNKGVSNMGQIGKSLSAGLGSLGKSLMKALGPALLLAKAIQFVVELFISADKNMVSIAKNTGVTRIQAEKIRKEFIQIAASSDNILVNSESLLKAQYEFIKALGATTVGSKEIAEGSVFLTENLGISGEKAAELQLLLSATGADVAGLTDRTIDFANAQAAQNGYLISGQEIMREMANTSSEIQSYYGFQADALAKAVFQTRKLGLNLTAAGSISKSLLNFESSIAGELELELLTSKQMNFERARALSATGKLGQAAEEVMTQMMSLTDEQMKSPIILEAAAAASGLSVEQLTRARLVQKNLNKEQRNYIALLREEKGEEAAQLATRLGLQGASRDEIIRTLTAQDKFNASLTKAKDQFTGLVNSGALQTLADVLVDLTEYLSGFLGSEAKVAGNKISAAKDRVNLTLENDSSLDESKVYKQFLNKSIEAQALQQKATTLDEQERKGYQFWGGFLPAIIDFFERKSANKAAMSAAEDLQEKAQLVEKFGLDKQINKVDDFILRPGQRPIKYNQDDLIMGGTSLDMPAKKDYEIDIDSFKPVLNTTLNTDSKVSEKTNMLLEKLISAVKSGGDVYIDGNKAGRAMVLGQHKLS